MMYYCTVRLKPRAMLIPHIRFVSSARGGCFFVDLPHSAVGGWGLVAGCIQKSEREVGEEGGTGFKDADDEWVAQNSKNLH